MNNKGFTLVELLAVIVIVVIITLLTNAGVNALQKGVNQSIWNSNKSLIETSAAKFGSDRLEQLKDLTTKCTIDNKEYNHCMQIKVNKLIEKGYLKTKDKVEYEGNTMKVVINPTIEKDESTNINFNNGYYVNEKMIYIYVINDIVYAKYMG